MSDDWDKALEGLLGGELSPTDAASLADAATLPDAAPPVNAAPMPAQQEAPQLALLVTGIGEPQILGVLLRSVDIGAHVLNGGPLALAVLDDPDEAQAAAAAEIVSSALPGGDLVLLRRGPSQDPSQRDIQAYAYKGGKVKEVLPPPLVLAELPGLVEDLLLDPAAIDLGQQLHSSQAELPTKAKRWRRLRQALEAPEPGDDT